MEATALKRALLYIVAAVILGLTIMLLPATIIAKERDDRTYLDVRGPIESITPQIMGMSPPASGLADFRYSAVDFTVLAACLAVALAAYFLVKRRMPRHTVRWMPPY